MTRRILVLAVVALLAALFAPSALAAKSPHRYSPHHGAKCRAGYKRVAKRVRRRTVRHSQHRRTRRARASASRRRRHRKAFCVKRRARQRATVPLSIAQAPAPAARTAASASEAVKLHAHLDPTFTRNPLDPFAVTYAFSASATQEIEGLAASVEPAPLPSGVLALYSDGLLECAINVGGSATGSECPVDYSARGLGNHSVTTIYTSGEESATETEIEYIAPIPTATTLDVAYADRAGGPRLVKSYVHCLSAVPVYDIPETCDYTYEWLLGTATVSASSNPAGAVALSCSGAWCPGAFRTVLNGSVDASINLKVFGQASGPEGTVPRHPTCEQVKVASREWSYPTALSIDAAPLAVGYLRDSASKTLAFSPALPC